MERVDSARSDCLPVLILPLPAPLFGDDGGTAESRTRASQASFATLGSSFSSVSTSIGLIFLSSA